MNVLLVVLVFVLGFWWPPLSSPVYTQGIQGFVSVDCGSSPFSIQYVDSSTGITWDPDGGFGLNEVSSSATVDPPPSALLLVSNTQLNTFRYFPGNHTKYCYTFNDSSYGITSNTTYLVRATFWAGNNAANLPLELIPNNGDGILRFQLLINSDVWTDVSIPIPQAQIVQKEVFVVALSSSISVCLSGAGLQFFDSALGAIFGTPFISSLEIRPIPIDAERIGPLYLAMRPPSSATTRAVHTVYRYDYGSSTGISVRYPADIYDRIWQGMTYTPMISTTTPITGLSSGNYVPSSVMQTAYTNPLNEFDINFTRAYISGSRGGYAYSLYFAEISDDVTGPGQRVFRYAVSNDTFTGAVTNDIDLYLDVGKYAVLCKYSVPPHITFQDGGYIRFHFTSNLGMLISALELYEVSDYDASPGTDGVDAASVSGITEAFPSVLGWWSGDPCLPYPYDWLRCSSDAAPRIVSLSLAHKGLSGVIPSAIANLSSLQMLDLQGNNLMGHIPDFLGSLPYLTTLLLDDNNLSGEIPSSLLQKVASHALNFSYSGNPDLLCEWPLVYSTSTNTCSSPPSAPPMSRDSPHPRHGKLPSVVGGSIGGVILFISITISAFYLARKHCKGKLNMNENGKDSAKQTKTKAKVVSQDVEDVNLDVNQLYCFTYQDIENITNSFSHKLGRGGFGDVFLGRLSQGVEVAVKVSTEASHHGVQAFSNEVALLSRVHHRNLVKLIGYCKETNLMLVYEYMPNGSLDKILEESRLDDWRERLKIAIGAADGLEYLHNGCIPPIIHRDVKSSNILLDATMEGKISDFGISRSTISSSIDPRVTTITIMGTRGYIPPDIVHNNTINEKVDVYAFGVVLLELVAGQKPIFRHGYREHYLTDWVKSKAQGGELKTIVDPTISQTYNVSSMWKVIDVALQCVLPNSHERPQMSEVSLELKNALAMEMQGDMTSKFLTNINMNVYAR